MDNTPRDRMDEMANRLVQTVLSILPICAAVIGLLLQQQKDKTYIVVAVMIWLSILILIVSALLNLQVQRNPQTYIKTENDKLNRAYRAGLITFVIGMFLLLFSPSGFLLKAYLPENPVIDIVPAGSEFLIQSNDPGSIEHFSFGITYNGKYPHNILIDTITDIPVSCVVLLQDANSIYLKDQASKTVGITATINDNCIKGKYTLIIEAKYQQELITRKIVPIVVD